MLKWIETFIDRVFAVIGAIFFAQFPQFYLQYTHELAGHVAELKYQVGLIEHAALLSNKNLEQWVAKFVQNSDPDFILQGELLKNMINRFQIFQQAEISLQTTSFWMKPALFIRYADSSILYDTYNSFKFGFSFTLEGCAYTLFGLLSGYAFFQLIRSFLEAYFVKKIMILLKNLFKAFIFFYLPSSLLGR